MADTSSSFSLASVMLASGKADVGISLIASSCNVDVGISLIDGVSDASSDGTSIVAMLTGSRSCAPVSGSGCVLSVARSSGGFPSIEEVFFVFIVSVATSEGFRVCPQCLQKRAFSATSVPQIVQCCKMLPPCLKFLSRTI